MNKENARELTKKKLTILQSGVSVIDDDGKYPYLALDDLIAWAKAENPDMRVVERSRVWLETVDESGKMMSRRDDAVSVTLSLHLDGAKMPTVVLSSGYMYAYQIGDNYVDATDAAWDRAMRRCLKMCGYSARTLMDSGTEEELLSKTSEAKDLPSGEDLKPKRKTRASKKDPASDSQADVDVKSVEFEASTSKAAKTVVVAAITDHRNDAVVENGSSNLTEILDETEMLSEEIEMRSDAASEEESSSEDVYDAKSNFDLERILQNRDNLCKHDDFKLELSRTERNELLEEALNYSPLNSKYPYKTYREGIATEDGRQRTSLYAANVEKYEDNSRTIDQLEDGRWARVLVVLGGLDDLRKKTA